MNLPPHQLTGLLRGHRSRGSIGKGKSLLRGAGLWLWLLLAAVLPVHAIVYAADEARKLKSGPPPEYPELAKRLNLHGIARVQATVAPDGSVKDVKEIGGNPVLVEALTRAVKKWKYEPAAKTTVLEVKYEFTGQ